MESKLEIAKEFIRDNIEDAQCGIYFTRNIVGDIMNTIYQDGVIRIDICYDYEYFEVFGLLKEEQEELKTYYYMLKENL